jgi:hypothetical protein
MKSACKKNLAFRVMFGTSQTRMKNKLLLKSKTSRITTWTSWRKIHNLYVKCSASLVSGKSCINCQIRKTWPKLSRMLLGSAVYSKMRNFLKEGRGLLNWCSFKLAPLSLECQPSLKCSMPSLTLVVKILPLPSWKRAWLAYSLRILSK